MKDLHLMRLCFVAPASVLGEDATKTLNCIQTERPDSSVIPKAQLSGKILVVAVKVSERLRSAGHLKFSTETICAALSLCASLLEERRDGPLWRTRPLQSFRVAQKWHWVLSTVTRELKNELSDLIWASSFNGNQC